MDVFITWSGTRGGKVAELLREWIKCVLQASRPWVSSRDIYRGSQWRTEVLKRLAATRVGIVCITQDSKNAPWLLFEAGAVGKGLPENPVCTLLVDLQYTDVDDPLAMFQHTLPNRQGMLELVKTVNAALGNAGLDAETLNTVFEQWWPDFDKRFGEALAETKDASVEPARSDSRMLAELLERARGFDAQFEMIQTMLNPPFRVVSGSSFLLPQGIQMPPVFGSYPSGQAVTLREGETFTFVSGKPEKEEPPKSSSSEQ